MARVTALLLWATLSSASLRAEQTPKPAPRKPPVLEVRHDSKRISYRVKLNPGVPDPGKTVAIEVEVAEILPTPDPELGDLKPINEAELTAYLVELPKGNMKKRNEAGWIDGRWAVKLGDAGTWGLTFTPPAEGVYGFYLRGKSASTAIDYGTHVPVGIWPMPDGHTQNDTPPPLPAMLPQATAGDLAHGKAICAGRCRTDLDGAQPEGDTPAFLSSAFAASLSNADLLEQVMVAGPPLTKMELNDLLYYLRSLHMKIDDLFPSAAAYTSNEFTINEHGRRRLAESIGLRLEDDSATGRVFVVYTGQRPTSGPVLIPYDDRIGRTKLERSNKLGYVVFLDLPKERRATELAFALGREPVYEIVALRARDSKGRRDARLAESLDSFVGKGRFNDPASLRRGAKSLRKKILPVYLRAAELATMYYADEREFTAFDDELGGD